MQQLDDLDPAGTLAAAEAALLRRRAAEVEDLELIAHWADLHAADPRRGPGGRRVWCGEDRLVPIGGEGAPLVQELCLPELAVARRVHPLSVRAAMADVLDLRHRLPATWAVVRNLACEVWLARKVATLTRGLTPAQARIVDTAVAEAIGGEAPARVLELTRAKVIEVDRAGHTARLEAELRRRHVTLSPTDQHGLRHVIARLEAGDAVWLDATIERIAAALAARPDLTGDLPAPAGRHELRSLALGWLAHPEDVLDLLTSAHGDAPADTGSDRPPERATTGRRQLPRRPRGVVYVHLHQAALEAGTGVARVEDLGPLLLDQIRRLLGHAHVQVKPVIDLHTGTRVTAYEHPELVKERVHLRTVGEVFPHATRTSRALDLDHPRSWQATGPPGQTGDHNAAPLSRTTHRAKTHLPYQLAQLGRDTYLWRTPHGLTRLVDAAGTHVLPGHVALAPTHDEAIHHAQDRIARELRHGYV